MGRVCKKTVNRANVHNVTEKSPLVSNPDHTYKDCNFSAAPTPMQMAEHTVYPSTVFTVAVVNMLSNVYILQQTVSIEITGKADFYTRKLQSNS